MLRETNLTKTTEGDNAERRLPVIDTTSYEHMYESLQQLESTGTLLFEEKDLSIPFVIDRIMRFIMFKHGITVGQFRNMVKHRLVYLTGEHPGQRPKRKDSYWTNLIKGIKTKLPKNGTTFRTFAEVFQNILGWKITDIKIVMEDNNNNVMEYSWIQATEHIKECEHRRKRIDG